jgi:ribose transport system substrate-binding protein
MMKIMKLQGGKLFMKKTRKTLYVVMVMSLVLAMLVGCSSTPTAQPSASAAESSKPAETSAAPAEGTVKIGVAMVDLTNPFYVNMMKAGDDAAKDFGAEVIWKSSEGTLDKEISLVENFIEQKVDCILIDPIDAEGIKPVINKAGEAGIPVITMGNFVDTQYNTSTLYNDYKDTFTIGNIVAKQLGEEGKVALIFGNSGNFCSDERQRGFEDAIKQYPKMTLIEQPANWDAAEGMKVAADMIAANPDLKAIHSVSDGVTFGIQQAIKQAGKEDSIFLTSYDGEQEASQKVKSGEIALTLLTGSKRVGYWNVKMGVMLAKGENVNKKEYLSSHFVMTDALKEKVLGWGLAKDASIVDPDTGYKLFDDYRADLGPKK